MATCSFARALPLCGLPTELWDLVFSNSSLADLCTCRAVHPFLRALIDEKNMKRLKNAFQCSGLPSLDSALQRFAGSEEDTDRANLPAILKPNNHGTDSWAYIQLLGYGYCRVRLLFVPSQWKADSPRFVALKRASCPFQAT